MPGAGRDFQSPLGAFLSDDFRKIHHAGPDRRSREGQPFPGDQQAGTVFPFSQDTQHLRQVPGAVNPQVRQVGGFPGGRFRQDAPLQPHLPGQFGHRQGARHGPERRVQSQLTHDQVFPQSRQLDLPGCGDDAQSDGQVIPAAFLVQVGRRKVDHDFLAGDMESQGLQGGHRSQQALLDGDIRQADEVDADAAVDVDFHGDGNGFDADAPGTDDIDQHGLTG